MQRDKMLAIALGGPKRGADPAPADDDGGDDGHGHEEVLATAGDLIDALHSRDPDRVAEAFKAMVECVDGYDPDHGSDDGDDGYGADDKGDDGEY